MPTGGGGGRPPPPPPPPPAPGVTGSFEVGEVTAGALRLIRRPSRGGLRGGVRTRGRLARDERKTCGNNASRDADECGAHLFLTPSPWPQPLFEYPAPQIAFGR